MSSKRSISSQGSHFDKDLDGQLESRPEALKGNELLEYVNINRRQLNDNGDSLCIGAGYGDKSEDGSTTCRLDLFSTELIKAKKASHLSNSKEKAKGEILKTYSLDTLKNIAELGCISGKAYKHLQISENEQFFDDNKYEITCSLEDQFGNGYLKNSAERVGGENSHWKHRAVWRFIEMIAIEEVAKSNK
ncbi:hypothetical protein [Prochlorococcus sp. MIT 1307]|uniref:hypothetical protein n=1 Tax=Prochlorococcus sp. MIT 1307 TaxID=3096219 RepID=UPI002A7656C9|nr:hypothetical protein [Prochlorococcus sp. MIT 1307]